MKPVPVPLTLDAPPRFLFFDIDYVLVASVGLTLGIVLHGVGFGMVLSGLLCFGWSRARSGRGVIAPWHCAFGICRLMFSNACPPAPGATF